MAKRSSRRLVIDASVARSSGGPEATFPASKECRDFLIAVLTICHQVVMTAELTEEWNKHQSNFARTWRVSMVARKKLQRINPAQNSSLRARILESTAKKKDQKAVEKDFHLVEAALDADGIVVSLDETARRAFATAAGQVKELGVLVWANPTHESEECSDWLEAGATVEKSRQLGYQT